MSGAPTPLHLRNTGAKLVRENLSLFEGPFGGPCSPSASPLGDFRTPLPLGTRQRFPSPLEQTEYDFILQYTVLHYVISYHVILYYVSTCIINHAGKHNTVPYRFSYSHICGNPGTPGLLGRAGSISYITSRAVQLKLQGCACSLLQSKYQPSCCTYKPSCCTSEIATHDDHG